MIAARLAASIAAFALGCAGCGDPAPSCFADAGLERAACEGVAPPSFEQLHAEVLAPRCALPSCHGDDTPSGDLDLRALATSREQLARYVTPGAPECSELARRVLSPDPLVRMPPSGLDRAQTCAVLEWIRAGAH